jgi:hypothetical protein
MKKVLLLTVALLLLSSMAMACPPTGCAGLFLSETPSGDNNCVDEMGAYEVYCMCFPPEDGLMSVELMIELPCWGVTATTYSPNEALHMGDPISGLTFTFSTCQMDWCWPFHFTWTPSWGDTLCCGGKVQIVPHPVQGGPWFATCAEGYPPVEFDNYSPIYVCDCENSPLANKESSWGAIKSMYE